MKKFLIAIIILLMGGACFPQTVKKLERELSSYKPGESWGYNNHLAYQLLEMDPLNEKAIEYLVYNYAKNQEMDSIQHLYNRLIKAYPDNPCLYLILCSEVNAYNAGLTPAQQIDYLREAYKLDGVNEKTLYLLGKLYYTRFINEHTSNGQKAHLDEYAANSVHYLTTLCNLNESYKEALRYPLIQLSTYRGNGATKQFWENYAKQNAYFPVSAFLGIPDDWQTNFSVNVFSYVSETDHLNAGIESARSRIDWFSRYLEGMGEPVLSDACPTEVFRFTWLRTILNPIVIGLETNNDSIRLYWKVGTHTPGKLIEQKSTSLTLTEWTDFLSCIDSMDFWRMPSRGNNRGYDGSEWILEGAAPGKYHVVHRHLGQEIKDVCLELLKMTDLKLEQKDIY